MRASARFCRCEKLNFISIQFMAHLAYVFLCQVIKIGCRISNNRMSKQSSLQFGPLGDLCVDCWKMSIQFTYKCVPRMRVC